MKGITNVSGGGQLYNEHTQNVSSLALPTGSKYGLCREVEIEGQTVINNVRFGVGSSAFVAGGGATLSDTSEGVKATGNGTNVNVAMFHNDNELNSSDTYFTYIKAYVDNSLATSLYAELDGTTGGSGGTFGQVNNPTQDTEYELYTKSAYPSDVSGVNRINLITTYASTANANGGGTVFLSIIQVNLTLLGMTGYSESDLLEMARNGQFEGIKGVEPNLVVAESYSSNTITNGSRLELDTELFSVGTTKDSVNEDDGVFTKTKNIGEISLTSGQAINTTNIPLANTSSNYIAYQNDGVILTGTVDNTETLSADATVIYELDTPTTEEVDFVGGLISTSSSTCYNDDILNSFSFNVPK